MIRKDITIMVARIGCSGFISPGSNSNELDIGRSTSSCLCEESVNHCINDPLKSFLNKSALKAVIRMIAKQK